VITDIHAHLFDPSWYPRAFVEALIRDFVARRSKSGLRADSSAIGRQLCNMLTDDTGTTTVRIMDKVGIEKRVILILDWGVELGEAEKSIWVIHKEILSICQEFKDRLIGFAGIDPRREDAAGLLTWAFDSMGARGLKLHPTGGWRLTDPQTLEIVALAADRRLPVLVHLGKTVDVLTDVNAQPKPFLELARHFPHIPFIAGHSGFDLWEVFVEDDCVPDNVYFDVSGWQERVRADGSNIIVDLDRLHRAFPGRVCFGTDSPFYSFNLIPAEKQWMERVLPRFVDNWAVTNSSVPTLFDFFSSTSHQRVQRNQRAHSEQPNQSKIMDHGTQ
jgi:predicted TIM-barrel fold metal-dependent hydrolase